MALNFAGEPIPGSNGDVQYDAPMSSVVRTHYPGVNGETEIRLGKGGRAIRYPVWLYGAQFTTANALTAYLARLDERVQSHGDLRETGNITRTFRNVTFEGCVPLTQPIRDDARTMVPGATTYHCQAVLTFYQLTTKDDR
jgi:hypothetical protein